MKKDKAYLEYAQHYANKASTCIKVQVGSVIVSENDNILSVGCNWGVWNCKDSGCRRIKLYGDNSKEHRLPSDCDALHSEIDAICRAVNLGSSHIKGATIYVTRYPCEACARAIGAAGIGKVVYGRKESISPYTQQILESSGVEIVHEDWDWEDNNA